MAGVVTAIVLGSTHVVTGQNDTQVAANYAACEGYMTDLQAAFANGDSMDDIRDVAYDQYVQNPSGPYVFCWERTPDEPADDASLMILSVHPYLSPRTLGELVEGKEKSFVDNKEQVLLDNIQNELGLFFNYTEAFDQVATQAADKGGVDVIVPSGQEQTILGFIEEDPGNPDLLVNCGCRFTGVPPGERLDDNVASLKSGTSRAGALSTTLVLLLSVAVGGTLIWV